MQLRTVVLSRTKLYCRAPHPDPRFPRRVHGAYLFELPILVEPTGQILRMQANDGMVHAFCSRCGVYTEYEMVTPQPTEAAA